MSKHKVTHAALNRKNLVFEGGRWIRKGRFKLNDTIKGKFELQFINGFEDEVFITNMHLPSYKYIRQETFYNNQELFKKQILELIIPKIKEEIEEIKVNEVTIELPPLSIVNIKQVHEYYFIVEFKYENEKKEKLTVFKDKDDSDWKFEVGINNTVRFQNIQSSLWLKHLIHVVQEHDAMKVPMLF